MVVRFRQVADRGAAEALNGTALYVDRSQLPDDLEEDEFYHADLIGMAVRDAADTLLGRVTAFHDFGGGDIMEVELLGGATVLVPFTQAAVPQVDLAANAVVIDPDVAGLTDGLDDEDEIPGEPRGFDPGSRPRGPKDADGNR